MSGKSTRMFTHHISIASSRHFFAKALLGLAGLVLLAAPALARAQGDRTTFGAKPPGRKKTRPPKRKGKRAAWLKAKRPTPRAKRRLKRFATMIQQGLKVQKGKLTLDLDPRQLDKLGIPRRALGLCKRYVKEVNAMKAQGYVRFKKERGGVQVAPTKKLEAKLREGKAASIQSAGTTDISIEDAWCGHKIILRLNHADTQQLLDALETAEGVTPLATFLCMVVPGLQEGLPAVALAVAVIELGQSLIENNDNGNGVKFTVHTTLIFYPLWYDLDPQDVDDGWWPPW